MGLRVFAAHEHAKSWLILPKSDALCSYFVLRGGPSQEAVRSPNHVMVGSSDISIQSCPISTTFAPAGIGAPEIGMPSFKSGGMLVGGTMILRSRPFTAQFSIFMRTLRDKLLLPLLFKHLVTGLGAAFDAFEDFTLLIFTAYESNWIPR